MVTAEPQARKQRTSESIRTVPRYADGAESRNRHRSAGSGGVVKPNRATPGKPGTVPVPKDDEELARLLHEALNGGNSPTVMTRRRQRKAPDFFTPQVGGYQAYHCTQFAHSEPETDTIGHQQHRKPLSSSSSGPEDTANKLPPESRQNRMNWQEHYQRKASLRGYHEEGYEEDRDKTVTAAGSNSRRTGSRELAALGAPTGTTITPRSSSGARGSTSRLASHSNAAPVASQQSGSDTEQNPHELQSHEPKSKPREVVEKPAAREVNEEPAASKVHDQPAASKAEETPAASKAEEKPAANKAVEVPAPSTDSESHNPKEDEIHEGKFKVEDKSRDDDGNAVQAQQKRIPMTGKIPKLPMVRHNKKWYRARLLKDTPTRVLIEFAGFEDQSTPIWLPRDSDRVWRGSYKGKDWRYLGDGAWEPKVSQGGRRGRAAATRKGAKRSRKGGSGRSSAENSENPHADEDEQEGDSGSDEEAHQEHMGKEKATSLQEVKVEESEPMEVEESAAAAGKTCTDMLGLAVKTASASNGSGDGLEANAETANVEMPDVDTVQGVEHGGVELASDAEDLGQEAVERPEQPAERRTTRSQKGSVPRPAELDTPEPSPGPKAKGSPPSPEGVEAQAEPQPEDASAEPVVQVKAENSEIPGKSPNLHWKGAWKKSHKRQVEAISGTESVPVEEEVQGESDDVVDKASQEEPDSELKTLSFRHRRRKGCTKRRRSWTRSEEQGDGKDEAEDKDGHEEDEKEAGDDDGEAEEEPKVEEPPAPRITRNRLQQQQQQQHQLQLSAVEPPSSPRAVSQCSPRSSMHPRGRQRFKRQRVEHGDGDAAPGSPPNISRSSLRVKPAPRARSPHEPDQGARRRLPKQQFHQRGPLPPVPKTSLQAAGHSGVYQKHHAHAFTSYQQPRSLAPAYHAPHSPHKLAYQRSSNSSMAGPVTSSTFQPRAMSVPAAYHANAIAFRTLLDALGAADMKKMRNKGQREPMAERQLNATIGRGGSPTGVSRWHAGMGCPRILSIISDGVNCRFDALKSEQPGASVPSLRKPPVPLFR